MLLDSADAISAGHALLDPHSTHELDEAEPVQEQVDVDADDFHEIEPALETA
jgi:hypothetical protein